MTPPLHSARRTLFATIAAFCLITAACSEAPPQSGGSEAATTDAVTATPGTATPGTAAVGTDSDATVPESAVDDATVSTTTATDISTTDSLDTALRRAQDYVGGTAGVATGEPLRIGYVNQEGATPGFPEATLGLDAAVRYVNDELGGADGRPIDVERCFANSAEDGTKCAQRFLADDDISVVITGVISDDAITQPIFDTLQGLKPVLIGNPLTTPEFVATDGYALTPGAPGVLTGMAIFIANDLTTPNGSVQSVAVVTADTPAGRLAVDVLLTPTFERLGITDIRTVPVANTAGPQEYAAAISAAGARDADVVVPIVTVQGCIGTAQALDDLEIDTTVVATALCLGTPMRQYLEQQGVDLDAPDGWYFGNYGDSMFVAGDNDVNAYVALALADAEEAGISNPEYTGFAGPMFGNVLTLARLANEIGAANLTPESIRRAIVEFRGPQWGIAGPIECSSGALLPSLCGTQSGIERYADGQWTNIRSQEGGNAIDPVTELPA